ncbi:unnamed protein product [Bursaphelenchus okinawaensis]|uniref:Uncharacterized protein n=1 Tax=Bursaphelenchus okinawaensis TaxID=465554 RepID=A0A811LQ88_9BILA|nr:unnamed protein product [Bursaphelenchus okinawaensis]CAG9127779.1 unnamed protein product [Bursaphelenchus okinawaensis]
MADLFLNRLPAIDLVYIRGDLGNINVRFIGFYRKLHPIVGCLTINNPSILRFLIDLQIKLLILESILDFNWLPLNYIEVNEIKFVNFLILEALCQQEIVVPSVRIVTFINYEPEPANLKLIFENICSLFPFIKHLKLVYKLYVLEKNEPIRNHELFTHTRSLLDSFESILDWNQGKLNITIDFQVFYNGPINKELARKMTEYIGYKCGYNGDVYLNVLMFNVDLTMFVQQK